jgi:hypothetical protein
MIYPDGAAFSGMWENGVHTEFRDSRPEPPGTLFTTVVYNVYRIPRRMYPETHYRDICIPRESLFTSVSIVRQGPPLPVSLDAPMKPEFQSQDLAG